MSHTAFIFGLHSIREDLLKQFNRAGIDVVVCDEFNASALPADVPQEIVILCAEERQDLQALKLLGKLAGIVKDSPLKRPVVHLIFSSQSTLLLVLRNVFPDPVNKCFEVWPTTMQEFWAEKVIVRYPSLIRSPFPELDREPIGPEADRFVHLVIAGFDSYASSLAVKAAQVEHFPNYDGKDVLPLRTRITIIQPGICSGRDAFIARYKALFDNSFYRTIYPDKKYSELHHPEFEGHREDFVDVEWELHPELRIG